MCVTCMQDSESHSHLFVHCMMASPLWYCLFNMLDECWICSSSVEDLILRRFRGLGSTNAKGFFENVFF